MRKMVRFVVSLLVFLMLFSSAVYAAPVPKRGSAPLIPAMHERNTPRLHAPQFTPDQIIVKFKKSMPAPSVTGMQKIEDLGATGAQLLSVPDGKVEETIANLRTNNLVEYATPNYLFRPHELSDNALISKQWGLDNTGQVIPDVVTGSLVAGTPGVDINLPKTWTGRQTTEPVLVGLIDTGVDINHPDLRASIWVNPRVGQYGYNGDVHGWNFIDNNGIVFNSSDPLADAHGTHNAGIIAAKTKNRSGINGGAPNAKIVVLKFMDWNGGTLSNAILAIDYARKVGVKVINASWGAYFPLSPSDPYYDPELQPLGDAIQSSNILFVTSAGNDGINLDALPDMGYQCYPAGFKYPNVITVGALNNRGDLCNLQANGWDSNQGIHIVDLAAPGNGIVSSFAVDPSWGGSIEGNIYNSRTAFWGFGLQDINGQSRRAELLRRELNFLEHKRGSLHGKKPGVLLVDDDNSEVGYPDCDSYWTEALDELRVRYKPYRVSASVNTATDGPSLADMAPFDVVIWQTGRDGGSNPLLTAKDKSNLTEFVKQGGSLLLSGERTAIENPQWAAQLLQAQPFQLNPPYSALNPPYLVPLFFYSFSGLPGTNYEGFNCVADGEDFNSLPVSFYAFAPTNPRTARGGLAYRYAFNCGTSMSASFVSAVGALLYGKYPQLYAETARQMILASAKPMPDLAGKVATGGMVDAGAALRLPLPEKTLPGPGAYQESNPGISYLGDWQSSDDPLASGGHHQITTRRGASAVFHFTGTEVAWYGLAGPDQGVAWVRLDGKLVSRADTYSATPQFVKLFSIDNLAPGKHSIFIQNTGRANKAVNDQHPGISLDFLVVK